MVVYGLMKLYRQTTISRRHQTVVKNQRGLINLSDYFFYTERLLESNAYQHSSKAIYGANDYLSSYRYSLVANQTNPNQPNATITSNSNLINSQRSICIPETSSIAYTTNSISMSTSSTTPSATMHSFPKHWIWGRNLLYPSIANTTSYLSYLNGNTSTATDLTDHPLSTKTESSLSNSPVQITEVNSDDSSDNQDLETVSIFFY